MKPELPTWATIGSGNTWHQQQREEAEAIILPRDVRRAYRPNDLRDVFMDSDGRLWYAATDALRRQLPANPGEHKKIPPEFWRPDPKRSTAEHRAAKEMLDAERAEREVRRDLELVP